MRQRILDSARRLTIEQGVVPPLKAVADASGASKGGLFHHFPTRAALIEGLARDAINEIDQAMAVAARHGRAASTWLRLAAPAGDDLELYRAMEVAHRVLEAPVTEALATASAEATERWEALIASEVGDATRARVIRLVGDGLTFNALLGATAASAEDLESIEHALLDSSIVSGAR